MNQSAVRSNFKLFSKSYVFDPRPHFPFLVSAQRYWADSDSEESANADTDPNLDDGKTRGDALTLIFAHANGFHKEHWEPIIHRLFEQQRVPGGCSFRIQDMWAFDAPNHGDSAVMNEEVLVWGYSLFSWEDYARSIHASLAGQGSGVDVDFSKRNLVAVGHSMGAVAVRDTWGSAENAYEAFKSRPTWQKWDGHIMRIYVKHGLRLLPTAEYPDRKDGVTLKCTRKQEAAIFRDHRSSAIAYRLLLHLLKNIPTHITYGGIADFLRAEWQQDVLNIAYIYSIILHLPPAGVYLVKE